MRPRTIFRCPAVARAMCIGGRVMGPSRGKPRAAAALRRRATTTGGREARELVSAGRAETGLRTDGRACSWLRRGFRFLGLVLRQRNVVLRLRQVSHVHDELIPVGGKDRDGYPERPAGVVEGGAEDLEYGGVRRYPEKCLLMPVRGPRGDPVAVADLLDALDRLEVLHRALFDVAGHQQPRCLEGELH